MHSIYEEEEFNCSENLEDELHTLKALFRSLNTSQTKSLLADFEVIGWTSLHVNP